MVEELNTLESNEIWELVKLNPSMKIVGNKWVYKLKYNPMEALQDTNLD